jgi:uncharacterized membrane protein YphA (DoxX/SURF4 family)
MTTVHHHALHAANHHDSRPLIDRVAADYGNALWLVGRILIGGIFVQSGPDKLMELNGFAAMRVCRAISRVHGVWVPACAGTTAREARQAGERFLAGGLFFCGLAAPAGSGARSIE